MSQQINLFNPVFLRQKKYFSMATMLQALVLIALGSALFYGYAAYQVKQLARQSDETNKRYTAEQIRLSRYTAEFSPQLSRQLLEEELKNFEARAAAQQEIINAVKSGALGNTSGFSEYMRAFARQSVHGLWLTGFNISGDAASMEIKGAVLFPELLPAYIQKLGQEKVMRGKIFASLQMQQPKVESGKATRYVEFALQSSEAGGVAK